MVWGWNAFGMLDLVVALALGVVSANGSPLQMIHAGAGSEGVQMLPWSLIPTVLVPMFLIVHAAVFAQLARTSRDTEGRNYDHGSGSRPSAHAPRSVRS